MIVSKTAVAEANGVTGTLRTLRATADPASLRVIHATFDDGTASVVVADGTGDHLRIYVAEANVSDERARELVRRYLVSPRRKLTERRVT